MRPKLSRRLTEDRFLQHYWLKRELVEFCRSFGLPSSGSKEQLTNRVADHLAGRTMSAIPRKSSRKDPLPDTLTVRTKIGAGWRCSHQLRAFFVAHFGSGFRFNEAIRKFIATGQGKTLGQALEVYRESLKTEAKPIGSQFQYNRHMRQFKLDHPGASHAQAVAAWWEFRQGRG
ncbi:MAG: DUF6434 domain-containing protein [Pirellula sp.]